ncbi:unnamed protein product [Microthlaspi erraticum]|uniref:ATP-dependent DNA helicase n=1 Tax=Microthlaspi erraticum TaxID=1685480 RepID=A0A6D2JUC7_9BRAS|nr:unnamed protein product [Microthlaspi erraticum]
MEHKAVEELSKEKIHGTFDGDQKKTPSTKEAAYLNAEQEPVIVLTQEEVDKKIQAREWSDDEDDKGSGEGAMTTSDIIKKGEKMGLTSPVERPSRSIKYLFKYINKGQHCVSAAITRRKASKTTGKEEEEQPVDEIENFFDARYISAFEAVWRILGFPTTYRSTPVEKLTFHLEDENTVLFRDGDSVDSALARPDICRTMFLAWFDCYENYPEARELTYAQLPNKFVYDAKQKVWNKRKKGFAIGRLAHIPPSAGAKYFLRVLINKKKGARSYNDIKTVDGIVQPSYEEACYNFGLIDDDKEYIEGLKECGYWASGSYVCKLFAMMLLSKSLSMPKTVWETCYDDLSEDVLLIEQRKRKNPGFVMTEDQIMNATLTSIDIFLKQNSSSLSCFKTLPQPVDNSEIESYNPLLQDELSYPQEELRAQHDIWLPKLTDEKLSVYDEITGAVCRKNGGEVVLNVASSGIASLLLPGGRTAHSRFSIRINPHELSTCNIELGSNQAELLRRASLIIWDEAPMMSKHCFESLDRSLCHIMKTADDIPFGGKVVVFRGDFRQILPVIPRGNRAYIVMAALNSSYLWKHCKVLQLTKNMRLFAESDSLEAQEIMEFSEWILKLGDGKINEPNTGKTMIQIPEDILLKHSKNPIETIVQKFMVRRSGTQKTLCSSRRELSCVLLMMMSI